MSMSQSHARPTEPTEATEQRARGQNGGPPPAVEPRGYLFLPLSMKRGRFLVWLRRTHAWVGLWGAVLGLVFGASGILLNHRNEMKIPLASQHETRQVVAPPVASLQSAEALEAWLRVKFKLPHAKSRVQKKPGGPVPWGGGQIVQPENWRVTLTTPNLSLNAEYWQGDTEAHIEQKEANAWATLANFHKGSGMSNAWILLTDTLAGGLLVLAITGTLLWSRLHGPRLVAAGLIGTTLTASAILMLTTLSLS
ncbi:PepSY-associated TM helix domain-containing protein [Nitrosospira sp. Is2]|uniref:PepSY-associated TM helix domain-containing protein n=1 Tax=Nitrosospira sp. Is2 TaxID=3080532 RepID=UPI0029553034|nr:PepSY-associated TM helix domain-containing protein [Nitrosospira sp. Is2]WON72816.1 PepSY-associated TM helix domain-containing protein [Nitrosospira sp. Is2]